MNLPITDIGCPDIDTMVVLMVEIQRRPPPGRVGTPFATSFTWQRKSGEGCRIQCQHQNLWPGPPVQELPAPSNCPMPSVVACGAWCVVNFGLIPL
jgi:hypothetical protein